MEVHNFELGLIKLAKASKPPPPKSKHSRKMVTKIKLDKESSMSDHDESFARVNEDVKDDNDFPDLPILDDKGQDSNTAQIKEIKDDDLLVPKKTTSNTTVKLSVSNRIK